MFNCERAGGSQDRDFFFLCDRLCRAIDLFDFCIFHQQYSSTVFDWLAYAINHTGLWSQRRKAGKSGKYNWRLGYHRKNASRP